MACCGKAVLRAWVVSRLKLPTNTGRRLAPYSEPAMDELDAITHAYVSARYGEQPIAGRTSR